MFAKDILYFDNHSEVAHTPTQIAALRESLVQGNVHIARKADLNPRVSHPNR